MTTGDPRLYSPSICCSNLRIVSSGRSQRDRVGLERSGSAGIVSGVLGRKRQPTNRISMLVLVLDCAERAQSGGLELLSDLDCQLGRAENLGNSPGWASSMAAFGLAFVLPLK